MADTIRLRAGRKEGMPALLPREPGYVTDEKALYIGTEQGNVELCRAGQVGALELVVQGHGEDIEQLQEDMGNKLTANKTAALSSLPADADLAAVTAAYNSLIAALKASGVME